MGINDIKLPETKEIKGISIGLNEIMTVVHENDKKLDSLAGKIKQTKEYIKFLEQLLESLVKSIVSIKQIGGTNWEVELDTSPGSGAERLLKEVLEQKKVKDSY